MASKVDNFQLQEMNEQQIECIYLKPNIENVLFLRVAILGSSCSDKKYMTKFLAHEISSEESISSSKFNGKTYIPYFQEINLYDHQNTREDIEEQKLYASIRYYNFPEWELLNPSIFNQFQEFDIFLLISTSKQDLLSIQTFFKELYLLQKQKNPRSSFSQEISSIGFNDLDEQNNISFYSNNLSKVKKIYSIHINEIQNSEKEVIQLEKLINQLLRLESTSTTHRMDFQAITLKKNDHQASKDLEAFRLKMENGDLLKYHWKIIDDSNQIIHGKPYITNVASQTQKAVSGGSSMNFELTGSSLLKLEEAADKPLYRETGHTSKKNKESNQMYPLTQLPKYRESKQIKRQRSDYESEQLCKCIIY